MSHKSLLQQAMENRIGHNVPLNVRVKLESLEESNVEFSSIGNAWCSHIDVTFSTIYPADEKSSPLNQAADFLSNINLVPKENIAGYKGELEAVSAQFKRYIDELRTLPCSVKNIEYSHQDTRVAISVFEPPMTNMTYLVSRLDLTIDPDSRYNRKFDCMFDFELTDEAVEKGYCLTVGDGKLFSTSTLVNDYGDSNSLKHLLTKLGHLRELCVVNVGNEDTLDHTDPLMEELHAVLGTLCSEQALNCKQLEVKAEHFKLAITNVPFELADDNL